jgi:hypothetical protein
LDPPVATSASEEDSDYAAFGDIVSMRDAIEHPKVKNVTNGNANGWDARRDRGSCVLGLARVFGALEQPSLMEWPRSLYTLLDHGNSKRPSAPTGSRMLRRMRVAGCQAGKQRARPAHRLGLALWDM